MNNPGKLRAAAKTRGYDSLDSLARALVARHPGVFDGLTPRSLSAKLGCLDRGDFTWWRKRAKQLEALEAEVNLEAKALAENDQARRRGAWVFDEFPELPALNLADEQPALLCEPVAIASTEKHQPTLDDWLVVATGYDHEQHSMRRPQEGVQWLHAPPGLGRSLLLARFEARGRIEVVRGDTLATTCEHAPPHKPVVLAPSNKVSLEELVALARLHPRQPVLVISAYPLPRPIEGDPVQTSLPSWEWLGASPAQQARMQFASDTPGTYADPFNPKATLDFKLELVPAWRERLLTWVEHRMGNKADTLFSAKALNAWLGRFDPDEVLFGEPAAVLSLARVCHDAGERQLPKPDSADAGVRLIKQLGRADSRYLDLLERLTTFAWLDRSRAWHQSRPWSAWLTSSGDRPSDAGHERTVGRARRTGQSAGNTGVSALTRTELDAAIKARLLVVADDGNYRLRSQAEAALMLRDLTVRWLRSAQFEMWGAQVMADSARQQVIDAALPFVEGKTLIELCDKAVKLPTWNAEAIGATEALFIAVGLRFADGSLLYNSDLGELLDRVISRCLNDAEYISLPLSRALTSDCAQFDWTRACWGWNLEAPAPHWVPVSVANLFPLWSAKAIDWLEQPFFDLETRFFLQAPLQARIGSSFRTALAVIARNKNALKHDDSTTVRMATIGLLRAARGNAEAQPQWWHEIASRPWAEQILLQDFENAKPGATLRLAASLLETCGQATDQFIVTHLLVNSPLWRQLLERQDARQLFELLSSTAVTFAGRHANTLPEGMRCYIAEHVEPALLPNYFADWVQLFRSTSGPTDERLAEILQDDIVRRWSVANALWNLHPEKCIAWATDPQFRHQEVFLDSCPDNHIADVARIVTAKPSLWVTLKFSVGWVIRHLGRPEAQCAELYSLLALQQH